MFRNEVKLGFCVAHDFTDMVVRRATGGKTGALRTRNSENFMESDRSELFGEEDRILGRRYWRFARSMLGVEEPRYVNFTKSDVQQKRGQRKSEGTKENIRSLAIDERSRVRRNAVTEPPNDMTYEELLYIQIEKNWMFAPFVIVGGFIGAVVRVVQRIIESSIILNCLNQYVREIQDEWLRKKY